MPRTLTALAYGADPLQCGDLYLPDKPRDTVVALIHGGFWYSQFTRDLMVPLAEDLLAAGYAVWNIEYRRIGNDGGGYPGTLADASAAIDKLGELAREHGLDLAKLTAVGHSAGGQLALWLSGRHHIADGRPGHTFKTRVAAAVGQAPVADLVRAFELDLGSSAVAKLLGGSPSDQPDRYRTASPLALLPLGVPQLIVHGDADQRVPVEFGRDYATAARRANDSVRYVELAGADHFVHIDPKHQAWRTVVEWLGRDHAHA